MLMIDSSTGISQMVYTQGAATGLPIVDAGFGVAISGAAATIR